MTKSPIISLLDLHTGLEIACPLPKNHPSRFAVALGNFDGVHAAHRALLQRALRSAQEQSAKGLRTEAAVFCFRTLTTALIDPDSYAQLTTLEEKLTLFAECGIRYVFLADFPSLRDLSPSEFISDVLRGMCAVDTVCCGFNFRFGKNGSGTVTTLTEHFGAHAFVLPCLRMLPDGNISEQDCDVSAPIISSSEIRSLLRAGNIRAANAMLQRPYSLCGTVEYGKQLGREIGFPTANLPFCANKIVPAHGVYATVCRVGTEHYFAVSNIGIRPTVDAAGSAANCETHLLDFNGDLYGKSIEVSFLKRLRPEQKFSSLNDLRAAISRDITAAKTYFHSENPTNI